MKKVLKDTKETLQNHKAKRNLHLHSKRLKKEEEKTNKSHRKLEISVSKKAAH